MSTVRYWLVKTEPSTFSIEDFAKEGRTKWDGVRNYQARNNIKCMQPGDLVLVYHSVTNPSVVGLAEVTSNYYPDPSDESGKFCAIDMGFKQQFSRQYPLSAIRQNPLLDGILLLKQGRLSVMPITSLQFHEIISHIN